MVAPAVALFNRWRALIDRLHERGVLTLAEACELHEAAAWAYVELDRPASQNSPT